MDPRRHGSAAGSHKRRGHYQEGGTKKMRQSELKKLSKFIQEPDNLHLLTSYHDTGNDLNALYKSTTPLCAACRLGNTEVIRYLIGAGVDVNMADANSSTPLYVAASHGYAEVVQLLLNSGADPDIPNVHGCSAIVSAVTNGMEEATQVLINAGASVNVSRPNTFGIDVSILSYVLFAKSDWILARQLLQAGTLPHVFTPPLDFILLEDPQMPIAFLQTLLDAGFELYSKGWVKRIRRTFQDTSERQRTLLALLMQQRTQPRLLQQICRIKIRVTIAQMSAPGKHFREKIFSLPLPKSMKQYLALEE